MEKTEGIQPTAERLFQDNNSLPALAREKTPGGMKPRA